MTQQTGESYPKLRQVLGDDGFAELAQLIRKTYEANGASPAPCSPRPRAAKPWGMKRHGDLPGGHCGARCLGGHLESAGAGHPRRRDRVGDRRWDGPRQSA